MSIKSSRTWAMAGVVVLTLGGTVWGLLRWTGNEESDLPAELSLENLKAQVKEDPGKAMATIRGASRREDLTDEQRREVFSNMREVWQTQMTERVDEYFAAADDAKEALLDRHIDEFQKRMTEWSQQRERREQERKEAEKTADSDDADEGESTREGMHRRFGSRTQQERKEHSESRDPDVSARMMAYFSALRDRASARGISMWGGRGGSGGHGGGWHR